MVWLKECGITTRFYYYIFHQNDARKERKTNTVEMQQSRAFYDSNKKRIDNVLELLADEKSKKVWGGSRI